MGNGATADVLPECIIQKIVLCLSYKEAAKLSILSKTWRQAYLTHPYLELRSGSSGERMTTVDKIMVRYRDMKIPIDKFEFSYLTRSREDFIALQNGVKNLVFRDRVYSPYTFPIFKLPNSSLRELALMQCVMPPVPVSAVNNWNSLRTLSLSRVSIADDMLKTLLTSCSLIVDLTIHYCSMLEKIELRNLLKLRSLTLTLHGNQSVEIQAPSLENLYYHSPSLEELDIIECQNLKSLEISSVLISDSDEFPEHLISGSQFLERLTLACCVFGSFNNCRSKSLRVLKLHDCQIRGEIDAPNLISLEYEGRLPIHPFNFAKESSQLKHSSLTILGRRLDAEQLCRLRKLLSNSISWSLVTLKNVECDEMNKAYLQLHHTVATPKVHVLDVGITAYEKEWPTFVDALLWSCHPRRLNLSSTVKMITCFIDRLMYLKSSSHSISRGCKPWRSQLKDVKAYRFDWKNQLVELRSEELIIRTCTEKEKVYFLLDYW